QIYNSGTIIFENELIQHRHDAGILSRYDSNFILFKKMPNIEQLVNQIDYLKNFHAKNGQHFVKVKFPVNEVPPKELLEELNDYTVGFLELYAIEPHQFKAVGSQVDVKFVEENDLHTFLQLQYNEDLHYGEQYAKEKQGFLLRERAKEGHHQIIAYKNGQAVGSAELIETKDTIELDNFFVLATKRGLGVGTAIQQFLMDYAKNKHVILVADGEDSVREMYKKQNYQYYGFQYEALKVFEQ
ncbi:MAG: GNAT family N-acetyltransferase, partial [Lysinibacillus sp.]